MQEPSRARVSVEGGVEGDFRGKPGPRQVVVLGREGFEAACAALGASLPWTLRRANLYVEGLDLRHCIGARIAIGSVLLEVTEECEPCFVMDRMHEGLRDALAPEWRGGVACRVLRGGEIAVGDAVGLSPAPARRFGTLDELIDFLGSLAAVPSCEAPGLTELDHALQCAAELETRAPADDELQIAGLVHDVAHTLGAIDAHGEIGADATRAILGERVATLVSAHVPAKRWLVTVEPGYRAQLSADSLRSLALQGGVLSPAEVSRFAAEPHWRDALVLRRADDAAKVPGRLVPGLARWIEPLRRVATRRAPG